MQTQNLEIHDLYQRWAETYDEPTNVLVQAEERVLLRRSFDVSGKKILDVGCGTGRHAIRMAEAGAEVTGIDFSDKMLEVARKKAEGIQIRFVHADLRSIPLDEVFDMVTCHLVLNHVEDLVAAMREISRLTKAGGGVLISDMRSDHWWSAKKRIRLLPNFTTFGFRHTWTEYRAAFAAAGLRLDQRRRIYVGDAADAGLWRKLLRKFFAAGYVYELTKR